MTREDGEILFYIASVVSLRPLNPLPRSHWDCWISFLSLIETPEAKLVRHSFYGENYSFLLKFVSGFHGLIWNRESRFRSLIETAESASAVSLRPPNQLPRKTVEAYHFKRFSRISRRNRSHIRNGFSPWIRALGGIVWWKKRWAKILWHFPFKEFCFLYTVG
jgi:hypothetical protein